MRKTKLISLIAALTLIVSMFAGLTVAHAEITWEATDTTITIYGSEAGNYSLWDSGWGQLRNWAGTGGNPFTITGLEPDTEYIIELYPGGFIWGAKTTAGVEPVIRNISADETTATITLANVDGIELLVTVTAGDTVVLDNAPYTGAETITIEGLEKGTSYDITIKAADDSFTLTDSFETDKGIYIESVTETSVKFAGLDSDWGGYMLWDAGWNQVRGWTQYSGRTIGDLEPGTTYNIELFPNNGSSVGQWTFTTLASTVEEPVAPEVALTAGANAEEAGTFWFKAEYAPNGEAIEAANIVVVGADKTKTFDIDFGAEADLEGGVAFLLGIEEAPAGDYVGTASITTAIGTATSDALTVTVQ